MLGLAALNFEASKPKIHYTLSTETLLMNSFDHYERHQMDLPQEIGKSSVSYL